MPPIHPESHPDLTSHVAPRTRARSHTRFPNILKSPHPHHQASQDTRVNQEIAYDSSGSASSRIDRVIHRSGYHLTPTLLFTPSTPTTHLNHHLPSPRIKRHTELAKQSVYVPSDTSKALIHSSLKLHRLGHSDASSRSSRAPSSAASPASSRAPRTYHHAIELLTRSSCVSSPPIRPTSHVASLRISRDSHLALIPHHTQRALRGEIIQMLIGESELQRHHEEHLLRDPRSVHTGRGHDLGDARSDHGVESGPRHVLLAAHPDRSLAHRSVTSGAHSSSGPTGDPSNSSPGLTGAPLG